MPQKTIEIIGAGIAGLTLCCTLLKHGIRSTVYERKPASSRHSYAITLLPQAYNSLLNLLNLSEESFRQRVAVPVANGRIEQSNLICSALAPKGSLKVHRGALEELLREGCDIRWDCGVERVERSGKNSVVVHLDQGTRLENMLLIGADGPHSKVRNGLLKSIDPTVLPYVVFNGKRRIALSSFGESYAPSFGDSTVLEQRVDDTVLSLSIFDRTDDNISLSWIYSRPARSSTDALHNPSRAPSGTTDTPREFFFEIESLSSKLTKPFSDIFDVSRLRKDRILHWLMRTVEIPNTDIIDLARDDVILIGDAAHAEPILGGEGANNAIADAVELAEAIATGAELDLWIKSRGAGWHQGISKSKDRIAQLHEGRNSNL